MVHDGGQARTVGSVAWALGLSVAVHALLVVLIQDQPGGASSLSGAPTLTARIEPASTEMRSADPSVDTSTTAAGAADSAVSRIAQPDAPALLAAKPPADKTTSAASAAVAPSPMKPADPTGIEMPFVRDPTYYAMAALDTPPRLLGSAEACYPAGAVGEVAFLLSIDEVGVVNEAVVVSVRPEGLFTGAAAELCARLRFTPATKGGRAVRSRIRLVVGQTPS